MGEEVGRSGNRKEPRSGKRKKSRSETRKPEVERGRRVGVAGRWQKKFTSWGGEERVGS
jgi:hypothetical protein